MKNNKLPWQPGTLPLMLAPMQGLTNRGLRGLFIQRYRPDLVFTEFVRVQPGARKPVSETDRLEVVGTSAGVPLVVQLIGSDCEALVVAADIVQELGAEHLNINLGCPYGRMAGQTAGGGLLQNPAGLGHILGSLRRRIRGSFSVKARSGFDDPAQLLDLLPLFEDCGVDFLIIHPRTVRQRYSGLADHGVTAEAVRRTGLPVIANGDICRAADGHRVLARTGAAGLMLGRGAIADPLLFQRLRGSYPAVSSRPERAAELHQYLLDLLACYRVLFCGDDQILSKMKKILCQINDPDFSKPVQRLKRCRKLGHFTEALAGQLEPIMHGNPEKYQAGCSAGNGICNAWNRTNR